MSEGQPVPMDPEQLASLKTSVTKRLTAEGRWGEVAPVRDAMMRECRRSKGMTKEEAQAWAYSELDRLYPPLPTPEPIPDTPEEAKVQTSALITEIEGGEEIRRDGGDSPAAPAGGETAAAQPADPARTREAMAVPADWPELPPNSSLAAEIAWVQAERLRVVEERPGQPAVIRLERARSPAPSWSALSWLETSIRSYAKFIEVAAKVAGAGQDEQDQAKRERMQLDEVRDLLAEMM